jgi:hypothetical protein
MPTIISFDCFQGKLIDNKDSFSAVCQDLYYAFDSHATVIRSIFPST